MKRWLALALVAIGLAACGTTSHGTHGMDLSAETAQMIRPGMTQSEVRSLIGDPYRVTEMADEREMWTYRYFAKKVDGKYVFRPVEPSTDPKKPAYYHGAIFVLFDSKGRVGMVRRG
jgi:outer membrane protein assembly factor BamE (lipoprotein component of BamABCDE complex)